MLSGGGEGLFIKAWKKEERTDGTCYYFLPLSFKISLLLCPQRLVLFPLSLVFSYSLQLFDVSECFTQRYRARIASAHLPYLSCHSRTEDNSLIYSPVALIQSIYCTNKKIAANNAGLYPLISADGMSAD